MITMTIDKLLEAEYPIEKAEALTLDLQISYQKEEEGIRAVGSLLVQGKYQSGQTDYPLNESIDVDIMAMNQKLLLEEPFAISVAGYRYEVERDALLLSIDLCVEGVKDTEREEEVMEKEEIEIAKAEPKEEKNVIEEHLLEDLFDDSENSIAEYRAIIAQKEDSYASIAQRHAVDRDQLIAYNQNKPLALGTVVYLPAKTIAENVD